MAVSHFNTGSDIPSQLTTLNSNITTLVNSLKCITNDNRSPKEVAWELYSQHKSGVHCMYVNSSNADYSTLYYSLALMIIGGPSTVLGCIVFSTNGKIYYASNLGNQASGWTDWKAITGV